MRSQGNLGLIPLISTPSLLYLPPSLSSLFSATAAPLLSPAPLLPVPSLVLAARCASLASHNHPSHGPAYRRPPLPLPSQP
jgi:hypothetical protein